MSGAQRMCGPFVVETVHPAQFDSPYRVWLPSNPSRVWEFENARALEHFFRNACAQVPEPK
jgi:hypothetical protein